MKPTLTLQIIHTIWTKKSRGGVLAGTRNAVPLAFPLENPCSGFLTVERVVYSESGLFQTPQIKREQLELTDEFQHKSDGVSLRWNGREATTQFQQTRWVGGAPEPKIFDERVGHFILVPGEWARLRWRGRFSDYDAGSWWYEHTCINVGYFIDAPPSGIFLQSKPTRQFVHLPHLR